MTPAQLHPEALVEKERARDLDESGRRQLAQHRASCAACAVEAHLASGFEAAAAPTEDNRARATRIVEQMFSAGAPIPNNAPRTPAAPAPPAPPRTGLALAASCAVHAALLALAVLVGDVGSPDREVAALTFELLNPSAPRPTLEPVAPERVAPEAAQDPNVASPARPPQVGAASQRARVPRDLAPTGAAVGALLPQAASEPPTEAPSATGLSPDRLSILLAPASVARAGWTAPGAPSRTGPAASRTLEAPGRPSEQEIEAGLAAGLRRDALARAYLARARPELRRRADGSHVYAGHRFEAIVRPDGSVVFDDRPNVQLNGISSSGSFDLTEAFMSAAGQDPHFAEREWFMRHTEELRGQLEAAHRAQTARRGLHRLRGRLGRIWSTTARSHAARRARLFELWDDMSDDEVGRRGRALVIAFVRETLPVGSENAYPEAELARLDARRQSREHFAPY